MTESMLRCVLASRRRSCHATCECYDSRATRQLQTPPRWRRFSTTPDCGTLEQWRGKVVSQIFTQ